jgi:hypothetical protein
LWFNFDGLEIATFAATIETATALSNGVLSGDTGADRAVQDRLAARHLHDARRDRGDAQGVLMTT